jgi:hypothetical protein
MRFLARPEFGPPWVNPSQQHSGLYSPIAREKIKMTMQVGLVGIGGIVLASDTRITREPDGMTTKDIGRAVRCASACSKIEFSDNRSLAVSCAEDADAACLVARHIISDLTEEELANPETIPDAIVQIAESTLSQEKQRVQCLIVLAAQGGLLFRLQFGQVDIKNPDSAWKAECGHCVDRGFAGDVTNPSVYWAERYHSEFLPVEQLVPLAAQLIISAHLLNSGFIDGLEIVVCKDSAIVPVPPERVNELRRKAIELDRTIGNLVFDDTSAPSH